MLVQLPREPSETSAKVLRSWRDVRFHSGRLLWGQKSLKMNKCTKKNSEVSTEVSSQRSCWLMNGGCCHTRQWISCSPGLLCTTAWAGIKLQRAAHNGLKMNKWTQKNLQIYLGIYMSISLKSKTYFSAHILCKLKRLTNVFWMQTHTKISKGNCLDGL